MTRVRTFLPVAVGALALSAMPPAGVQPPSATPAIAPPSNCGVQSAERPWMDASQTIGQ